MATTNKNFKVKNGLDVNGEINVSAVGGDEGGQINLEKPATGTTLSGNVSIDIYQNRIRIFDAAGTNKGAYIDLSAATDGVGSNLLAGGGAGITSIVEDTTPQLGGDLDAQGYDITNLNSLTFDTTPTSPGTAAGTIYWDDGDGVPKAILNANVTVGVNQELILKVKNATGTTITKGSVVYINGAQGQNPTIALANATTEVTSSKTFGFTAEAIVDGAEGFLIAEGIFRGANTDGLVEGDPIYLSTTAGQYTQTIPAEPAHSVFLGYVVKAHASAGEIIVKIQNGYELTELHGVTIANTAATNDILQLNSSGIWVNANLATAGIANLSGATFTGNIAGTNLALSGKDIFSNTGTGAPTFTTYSSGVRTVFYDNVGGTSVGYSRGIDAGVLWDSIPAADAGMYFKWYGGETQVASLSGSGTFTTTNVNATTINATTFNGSGAGLISIPSIVTDDTKPSTPVDGQVWFNSATGKTYVYYDDSTSNQWVEIFGAKDIVDLKNRTIAVESNVTATQGLVSNVEANVAIVQSDITAIEQNVGLGNYIINGAFDFWQRGTSSTANAVYIADRWIHSRSNGSHTVSQSTDVPTEADVTYSLSFAGSGSTSSANPTITQRIESVNSVQFAGKTVTLSLWAKSTAGSSASINWSATYPTATDNWASETADTSGTFAASMTNGVWTKYTATFTTNALATRGYTIKIYRTGVSSTTTLYAAIQLELGSNATTFRRAGSTYTEEQAACWRYYQRHITILGRTDSTGVWKIIGNPIGEILRATPTSVTVGTMATPAAGGNIGTNVTLTLSGRDMYYTSTGASSNGAWLNFDDVKVECEL